LAGRLEGKRHSLLRCPMTKETVRQPAVGPWLLPSAVVDRSARSPANSA
jgi:hypothetical protein